MKSKIMKGHGERDVFVTLQSPKKNGRAKSRVSPVMSLHVTAPAAPRVTVIKGLAKNTGTIKATIAPFFFCIKDAHPRMSEHNVPMTSGYQYNINV